MPIDRVRDLYFEWLCRQIGKEGAPYRRLFLYLFDREFTYILPMDSNRAADGIRLRMTFSFEHGDDRYIVDGPCSVFEMMVALSVRCETDIMDDPAFGNRTGQWFFVMISSLGLDGMTDSRFDEYYVKDRIDILLNRNYSPNGEGGLFYIPGCDKDLRTVEIWYQLLWYLNTTI